MGFVNMDLGDSVREGELVPNGTYDLVIAKAEDKPSKKGNPMTRIVIRIENASVSNPAPVMYYMNHITPSLPADQRQMRALEIKRFLTLFGVPYGEEGFETEDLVGCTAKDAMIEQEQGEDGQMRHRLILPRLDQRR